MHTSKKTTSAILSSQPTAWTQQLDRVVNDLLNAMDEDNFFVLLLLDLLAAFDTIDHQILLFRLETVFGIRSTALQWF